MKILKIVANGFKKCNNDFTISFLPQAPKSDSDKEFELLEIDEDLFVFSTMGIVGKNASGKTTVVELLAFVYDLFYNLQVVSYHDVFINSNKELSLDITFYHENTIYRYVTELYLDDSILISPRCYFKNQKLYKRSYKKTHSRNIFDYDKFEEIETNKLPEKNISILYEVFDEPQLHGYCLSSENDFLNRNFDTLLRIGSFPMLYTDVSDDLRKSVLKMLDTHISDIKRTESGRVSIVFADKTSKVGGDLDITELLSSGTNKGFKLFYFVIDSLLSGRDLVIDEIENHFHKTLVEFVINLYKDKNINKKNATLIFTTHYPELLELFNRFDNIWISQYGESINLRNAYQDYKLRSDLSKSKLFYKNAFGTNVDYESLMEFKRNLMK